MVSPHPAAVFVGAATYDAIALVDRYPGADERTVADDVVFAGGGPAATAAVAFARLGLPAAFVGAVGEDEEGRAVRDGLAAEGVDVSGLAMLPGQRTGASVIVVDRQAATRSICTRPVPELHVGPGTPGAALIGHADWVHVDHLGWAAVQALRAPGGAAKLSVDAGNPIPGFTPARTDLYVPTLQALRRAHPSAGPEAEDLLEAALAAGAQTVVATLGADGSIGADRAGQRALAATPPVPVLSTLGAGDVFHGALLAAVVRGMTLAAALPYANAVAALSCRGLDGRSAIPSHEQALDTARSIPVG